MIENIPTNRALPTAEYMLKLKPSRVTGTRECGMTPLLQRVLAQAKTPLVPPGQRQGQAHQIKL